MASSAKRPLDDNYVSPANDVIKKGKLEAEEEKPSVDHQPAPPVIHAVLNAADCNLEKDGLHGSALSKEGFAYCWSGARANVGILGGKYCFGCKIIAHQPVDMDDTPLDQQHVCRIGISRGDNAVENLGETLHSFGFGGTAKFSNAGKFVDYGEKFDVGDTIICCVDLESKPMASIGFSKNGKWLGVAMQFHAGSDVEVINSPIEDLQSQSALFPHVLLKNVEVQMQFRTEDGLIPQEGYKPWASAIEDQKVILGPTFQNASDCQLMMMVGLPASGKSTWAENYVKAHPEKRYMLLGTNLILDQMKVPGLRRRHNYGERFDLLIQKATAIFNTLLSRAPNVRRNFIIDQTNVYKNARKCKLKPFLTYHKIAVVVFPRAEELKNRADKRFKEMGKEVPAEAVNEMLANYILPMTKDMPNTDEYFDEVFFPELSRAESQRCLDQMKANLKASVVVTPHSVQAQQCSLAASTATYGAPQQNQGGMGCAGPWSNNANLPYPPVGTPPGSNTYSCHGVYFQSGGSDGGNRYAAPVDVNVPCRSYYGAGPTCTAANNNRMNITEPYASRTAFNSQDVYATRQRGSSPETAFPSYGAPLQNQGCFPDGMGFAGPWSSDFSPYSPYSPVRTPAQSNSHSYPVCSQPQGLPPVLFRTGPPTIGSTAVAPYGFPYGAPIPRPSYGNLPACSEIPGGYGPSRPQCYPPAHSELPGGFGLPRPQ